MAKHGWLVVEPYPSEKYEFVNGKDDIPYMKWKIKNGWNHQPENKRCQKKIEEAIPSLLMATLERFFLLGDSSIPSRRHGWVPVGA